MNKKIKITITSIIIAFVCLLIVFFKPVLSYGIVAYLNSHTKSYEKSSIATFKKFEIKNRKLFLKGVNISAKDKYSIEIDRLDIGFKFHFFRPKIITNICISKPNVTVYKNDNFDFSYKASKKSFFSTLINIEKANINFIDHGEKVKQLLVDLSNISENSSKLEMRFDQESSKKICIDINQIENRDVFSLYLDEIEMSNINEIISFFNVNLFQDLKGIANGIVVVGAERGKICKFFTNLDFVNFSFLNPKTNLKFDCNNFRLETNYPDTLNQKSSSFLDFIKYDFLKETQIRLHFENLTVLTSKKSNFSKIEGSFSYNPNLGSKLNILGKIENEKSFDFQINSKAYSASSFANWLDFNFSFDDNKTKICFSAKEINDFYNLHLSFENIKPHIFKAFQDLVSKSIEELNDFKYIDGDLSFCIDTRVNQRGVSKVFLTDLLVKDFDFQKDNIKGFISKVEGKSSFDLSKKNFLDKFFSDIKISPSNFNINKKQITDFSAKIFALDGSFQSSSIACFIEDIETKAEIKGPINTFSASIFAKGMLPNLEDSFISEISLRRKLNNYQLSGNFQVLDGQEMVFGFDLEKLFIFNLQELKTSIQKLWLRAEKLKLNKWPKVIDSDLDIDGIANIAMFYDKEKLELQIKGENLSYKNPYIDLRIDKVGNLNDFVFEGDNFINVTLDNKLLSCNIFDFQGRCFLPKFDVDFDIKNAVVKIDENILSAKIQSKAQGVDFDGLVSFDFSKQYPLLNIETNGVSNVKSMQNLLKHFDFSNELDLSGDVVANGKITTYFDTDPKIFYSLAFDVSNAAYQINEKTLVKNIEAKAKVTSDDIFTFSNFIADLEVGTQTYAISCPVFEKNKDKISFDFRLEKQTFDFLRLIGDFIKKDDSYELDLDKNLSHIASEKFRDLNLLIDENFNVKNFHCTSNLNSYAFISMLQFVVDSGSIFMDDVNINSIIQSKHSGELLTTCDLKDNKDLYFELKSKNFKILDKKLDNFCLKGKKTLSHIEIQKLMFNDFESALFLNIDQNKLKINDWTLKRKDELFLKMNGTYVQDTS
ncbi:MAG: hypothetical protein KR126chlam6_01483, partial [Candidatus Anoxychlamydiales bacterium]|nr:hypothetical protein [Candidatus Anoxychlamydiales bacterium]